MFEDTLIKVPVKNHAVLWNHPNPKAEQSRRIGLQSWWWHLAGILASNHSSHSTLPSPFPLKTQWPHGYPRCVRPVPTPARPHGPDPRKPPCRIKWDPTLAASFGSIPSREKKEKRVVNTEHVKDDKIANTSGGSERYFAARYCDEHEFLTLPVLSPLIVLDNFASPLCRIYDSWFSATPSQHYCVIVIYPIMDTVLTICNHFASQLPAAKNKHRFGVTSGIHFFGSRSFRASNFSSTEMSCPNTQSNDSNDPNSFNFWSFRKPGMYSHRCKIYKASSGSNGISHVVHDQMPTVTQQPTTGPHSLCPRVVAECIQPPLPAHEVPGQNTSRFSGINGSTARAKVYNSYRTCMPASNYPPGRCQRT